MEAQREAPVAFSVEEVLWKEQIIMRNLQNLSRARGQCSGGGRLILVPLASARDVS